MFKSIKIYQALTKRPDLIAAFNADLGRLQYEKHLAYHFIDLNSPTYKSLLSAEGTLKFLQEHFPEEPGLIGPGKSTHEAIRDFRIKLAVQPFFRSRVSTAIYSLPTGLLQDSQ